MGWDSLSGRADGRGLKDGFRSSPWQWTDERSFSKSETCELGGTQQIEDPPEKDF